MVVQKISNHSSVMTTSSRFLATNKNQSHFVESTSPEDVMATFRSYPQSQIGGCCMHCIPLLPSITITHVGTFRRGCLTCVCLLTTSSHFGCGLYAYVCLPPPDYYGTLNYIITTVAPTWNTTWKHGNNDTNKH